MTSFSMNLSFAKKIKLKLSKRFRLECHFFETYFGDRGGKLSTSAKSLRTQNNQGTLFLKSSDVLEGCMSGVGDAGTSTIYIYRLKKILD